MTLERSTASATKPRLLNDRIKEVQAVNATRTIQFLASTVTTLAGLALMLTTHDATVHMLAVCLVANEIAGGGRL